MCGIGGIARHTGRPVAPRALAAMAAALRHRGPDGFGFHRAGPAALVHVRLSVIDPAGGAQPMATEDGRLAITYNGEVYNHAALRRELEGRGHRFRSRCDTEVVLRGYAEWGEAVLDRLVGQFAFAVADAEEGSVFLARDRFGVRPLLYALPGGDLCFASEARALFASGEVEAEPDARGLDEVFTFWAALAPRTVFRGVHALPPGCCARWRGGRLTVRRWYALDYPGAAVEPADALERLDDALREAVELRMRADVPVGAYLSGGLDSSATCALAAPLAPGGLRTYSVAFADATLDESPWQAEVAARLGTAHATERVDAADVAAVFPEVVRHAETPLLRTAPAPMYLLARRVRAHGTPTVLTGEGADELFLGYDLFREAAVRRFALRRPDSPARLRLFDRLYPYVGGARGGVWARGFLAAGPPSDPLFSHLPRAQLAGRVKEFLAAPVRAELAGFDALDELRGRLPAAFARWSPSSRAAYLEMTTLLEPYLLSSQGDRMSMAHGVEGRYPFLDHRLFELAAALPGYSKLAGLRDKAILRRWARPHVPPSVLRRPKQPYRAPDCAPFTGPARPAWVDELLCASSLRASGWWEPRAVEALAARCASRSVGTRESQALVAVLSTELWHRAFFAPGAHAVEPPAALLAAALPSPSALNAP
jgi:asparagine synthase (glutamine-hydrolysing)